MSGRQDGMRERDRWLLHIENQGIAVKKINQYVYEISGKKVNIKFTNPRPDNSFWFNTTPKRLREIEVFVWLCGKAEDYYVIPCEKMKQLIDAGNWLDKRWNYPTFSFKPYNHKYLPANLDVSTYYRNLSPFL